MVLVDSNVIIDILTEEEEWAEASSKALLDCVSRGIGINPIIYAECSLCYKTMEEYEKVLRDFPIKRIPLPFEAGFYAAKAFVRYRRSGGLKSMPLPDFYIGAHAEWEDLSILTRDVSRFRTYFPNVKLIEVKR